MWIFVGQSSQIDVQINCITGEVKFLYLRVLNEEN